MQSRFSYQDGSGDEVYYYTDTLQLEREVLGNQDIQPDDTIDQTIRGLRYTFTAEQVFLRDDSSSTVTRDFLEVVEDLLDGTDIDFYPVVGEGLSMRVVVDLTDRQTLAAVKKGVIQQGQRVRLLSKNLQALSTYTTLNSYFS